MIELQAVYFSSVFRVGGKAFDKKLIAQKDRVLLYEEEHGVVVRHGEEECLIPWAHVQQTWRQSRLFEDAAARGPGRPKKSV